MNTLESNLEKELANAQTYARLVSRRVEELLDKNKQLLLGMKRITAALEGLKRCKGIYDTDQETGDTFDAMIAEALGEE